MRGKAMTQIQETQEGKRLATAEENQIPGVLNMNSWIPAVLTMTATLMFL